LTAVKKSPAGTTKAAPAKKAAPAATKAPAKKATATKAAPAKKATPTTARKATPATAKTSAGKATGTSAPTRKAGATTKSTTKAPPTKATATKAAATKSTTTKATATKAAPTKAAATKSTTKATATKATGTPTAAPAATAPPAKAPAVKKVVPEPPKRPTVGPYAKEPKFLDAQRVLLLEERGIYSGQAVDLRAEADSLALEREPGDVQFDEESGEGGTVTVDRERNLALSAQAVAAVEEIDDALRKLDRKTYGWCERCYQPIPKARLQALPFARLCVACKSGGLSRR